MTSIMHDVFNKCLMAIADPSAVRYKNAGTGELDHFCNEAFFKYPGDR